MAGFDILADLLGPEWRGVPFPLVHLDTGGSTDLVEHRRPNQDGWHVESTGANNLVVSAVIPFRNNLRPAANEKWFGRTPYPELFRAFVSACADTTTGPLVHPELGQLNCKCRHFRWRYDPNRRDGCDMDVEWIQSLDEGEHLGSISEPSPIGASLALATQLDEQIATLTPPPPELDEDPISFEEMMRSLQAFPDTATLLSQQVGGLFHRIAAKIDAVDAALVRFNTVRYWPIADGIQHLRASLFDLNRKFGVDQKIIREYLMRVPMTLAAVSSLLGQNIDEMIRLNRNLLEYPVLPASTRVKYYKAAS